MNNKEIIERAMQQSAIDSNCCMENFRSNENKVVLSVKNPKARKYLELPFFCDLTSYGNNIVASVSGELKDIVEEYIEKYPVAHCFETPNLHILIERLKPFNLNVCFMGEYFLPDLEALKPLSCQFEIRVLEPEHFSEYYLPEWSNALCEKRKELDCLAVGAFDAGKLIGLAGGSADCDTMWQIGIDVLPEYRRLGIASSLTSRLAIEILDRGIVPFYCCAWSNVKSARNAIKSGFRPAWVQVTARENSFIDEMNR
ncbi:GNAT family N-acetyltransferase [Lacrimispora amygdalina]|uniref:GNAT family N-acetyltransferase n=1 Tax=Lacrimispora amygdalina TaxID=253257 RepID=A0A3E2NDI0_9FIRM|nr:GNAT family N-acetyltransferase [Clostridium indicum]RFZ79045.1 GNAT family N-acetyltransferase [Clostridium indicum]